MDFAEKEKPLETVYGGFFALEMSFMALSTHSSLVSVGKRFAAKQRSVAVLPGASFSSSRFTIHEPRFTMLPRYI